jgi:hypothetical protein
VLKCLQLLGLGLGLMLSVVVFGFVQAVALLLKQSAAAGAALDIAACNDAASQELALARALEWAGLGLLIVPSVLIVAIWDRFWQHLA